MNIKRRKGRKIWSIFAPKSHDREFNVIRVKHVARECPVRNSRERKEKRRQRTRNVASPSHVAPRAAFSKSRTRAAIELASLSLSLSVFFAKVSPVTRFPPATVFRIQLGNRSGRFSKARSSYSVRTRAENTLFSITLTRRSRRRLYRQRRPHSDIR